MDLHIPPQATLPKLDPHQKRAVDSIQNSDTHALVRGCPGSGKTRVAIEVAVNSHEGGQTVRMLAPDRSRADLLQPILEPRVTGVVRPVRTPVSFAYDIVNEYCVHAELAPPRLLTGAQQDQYLKDLIEQEAVQWPALITAEVTALPVFRMQVRNLIARVEESGRDGAWLAQLGQRVGREVWVSVGQLMQVWDERISRSETNPHLSAPALQQRAAQILRENAQSSSSDSRGSFELPQLLVVDDLQDCTAATLQLLTQCAELGTRIVACADADVAVATYRGGEPHLDGRLATRLRAAEYELGPTHRGGQALRAAVQEITARIPTTGSHERRTQGAVNPHEDGQNLNLEVFGSPTQEMSALVGRVHTLQYRGMALSDMAVIVRDSAEIARVRSAFMAADVETTAVRRAINYAKTNVTATLLNLLVEPENPDDLITTTAASALVNIDAILLRRLIDVVGVSAEKTDLLNLAEQVDSALTEDTELAARIRGQNLLGAAHDLRTTYQLIQLGQENANAAPTVALWKLWDASHVQKRWRERALIPTASSVEYDERLDAVISLMRSADVWSQRNPADTARDFARALLEENLPTDTLAQQAQRPAGVSVLTPQQAVGREWEAVFIVGLQDGAWPNLTLRDRITCAADITQLAAGQVDETQLQRPLPSALTRRAMLTDELRLLAAAMTRARQQLWISAARTEDTTESAFIDILAPHMGAKIEDMRVVTSQVAPGVDTRSLIARLRYLVSQPDAQPDSAAQPAAAQPLAAQPAAAPTGLNPAANARQRTLAAQLLALAASEGIDAADARTWIGAGGMSVAKPQETKREGKPFLSPSQVETLLECPAKWFMTRHGGDYFSTDAARLGNMIHQIAEEHPYGTAQELLGALDELWDENFGRESELDQQLLEKAQDMVAKLGDYFQADTHRQVEVEKAVTADVGPAIINGYIDRVETSRGATTIADIKTGTKLPSKSELPDFLQLLLYQLVLAQLEGPDGKPYDVQGARLIALTRSARGLVLPQPSIFASDEDTQQRYKALLEQLETAAELTRGPLFLPKPSKDACDHCAVRQICPAQTEGMRTIE